MLECNIPNSDFKRLDSYPDEGFGTKLTRLWQNTAIPTEVLLGLGDPARTLMNINTPEDLAQARDLAK